MNYDKSPWERLNRILSIAAVIIMIIWAWKWFGPADDGIRRDSERVFLSPAGLFWLGIAVASCGYLLWRFLDWLFWRKYFRDKKPPDEPMR